MTMKLAIIVGNIGDIIVFLPVMLITMRVSPTSSSPLHQHLVHRNSLRYHILSDKKM